MLRSEPEPCDSDPRLVRLERPLVAVMDEIEPRRQVEDSRLPEESELVSDALSAYMPRGEEKAAGEVDASMLAWV